MIFTAALFATNFVSVVVGGVIRDGQLCDLTQSDKGRTHTLVLENDFDAPMEYLFSVETIFTSEVKREILMPGERKNVGCKGNDPGCHASYKLVAVKLPATDALRDKMTVSERYAQLMKDKNHAASSQKEQEIAHVNRSTPTDHLNASGEAPKERTPAPSNGQVCARCGHRHPNPNIDSDTLMALYILKSLAGD